MSVEPRATRLLSRWHFRRRGAAHTAFKWPVFDPAHFIMETGVLHGVKTRAERQASLTPRRGAEVGAGIPSEGAIGAVP